MNLILHYPPLFVKAELFFLKKRRGEDEIYLIAHEVTIGAVPILSGRQDYLDLIPTLFQIPQ